MKKWILILMTVCFLQAAIASAVQYKVVHVEDYGRGKSLETALNQHATSGWELKEVIYRNGKGTMMVVFYKK